jgi:hypothetical protein
VTGLSSRALDLLAGMTGIQIAQCLPVYPTEVVGTAANLQSVAGRYVVDEAGVSFVARHPFLGGTAYSLLVHGSLTAHPLAPDRWSFDWEDFEPLSITRPEGNREPTTRVLEIYPTAPELPRNHLRLYVHFSDPMAEGYAVEHVHARRADTLEALPGVFLPMDPELWDPRRQRLTLLFDPARIKRGLAPHREIGYPLQQGVPIEVVVDDGFRDADGRPLAQTFVTRYDVGPDVRARIDPAAWRCAPPAAGTAEPFVVEFDRPLDRALLDRCLHVVDDRGEPVRGTASVLRGERSWQLRPESHWRRGGCSLVVDTILEDLAGNSVARVFDRELARPEHDPLRENRVILAFVVG